MAPDLPSSTLKRVELLGTAGVLILGVGAGAWLGESLVNYAVGLMAVGGCVHALSMYGKHRIESVQGIPQSWPFRILYWMCWVLLASLAAWLVVLST